MEFPLHELILRELFGDRVLGVQVLDQLAVWFEWERRHFNVIPALGFDGVSQIDAAQNYPLSDLYLTVL